MHSSGLPGREETRGTELVGEWIECLTLIERLTKSLVLDEDNLASLNPETQQRIKDATQKIRNTLQNYRDWLESTPRHKLKILGEYWHELIYIEWSLRNGDIDNESAERLCADLREIDQRLEAQFHNFRERSELSPLEKAKRFIKGK